MKTKQTRPNRHQVLGAAYQEQEQKEMMKKAAAAGFQIYILKNILWELVIECRVNRKALIDVMPYVDRILQMFK